MLPTLDGENTRENEKMKMPCAPEQKDQNIWKERLKISNKSLECTRSTSAQCAWTLPQLRTPRLQRLKRALGYLYEPMYTTSHAKTSPTFIQELVTLASTGLTLAPSNSGHLGTSVGKPHCPDVTTVVFSIQVPQLLYPISKQSSHISYDQKLTGV